MKKPTVYGRLLKDAMTRNGVSIQALTKTSGVSQTAIIYYRNGYRDPTREKMVEIARALGEPITAFFEDDEFVEKTPLEREESTVVALLDAGYTDLHSMVENSTMTKSRIDRALQRLRKRGRLKYTRRGGWRLSV